MAWILAYICIIIGKLWRKDYFLVAGALLICIGIQLSLQDGKSLTDCVTNLLLGALITVGISREDGEKE